VYCEDYAGYYTVILLFLAFRFCSAYFIYLVSCTKPVGTPMVIGCKLSKDDDSPNVDQRSYRSMIGSMLYITASHPDIIHVVGMVGRYQAAPK
jgi:hypothetical protein